MAINIFSGSNGKTNSNVNSAAQSTRAKAAISAVPGPAVASDSGTTAVGSSGALAKVGNAVGKIAGLASKFLPGVGGTIASGLANMLNDPEWWQSVPGEQITTNAPLRFIYQGDSREASPAPVYSYRPALAEFASIAYPLQADSFVLKPTAAQITQYLMPEIRKAVNAVPLQPASAYATALGSGATLYALWRNLKKYDYMLKHGQTYLPNLNDAKFPVFQVENASWLQSTINRLEEYLRANVRIPHTLCCYLAWRYGRTYKCCDSAKAALVHYNVVINASSISDYNQLIAICMEAISASEEVQKANTDLYNAYYDHDMMVEIAEHTQFTYDPKEFALRTNLDFSILTENVDAIPVFIDSKLDNTTAFMASTVSTYGLDSTGELTVLVPVTAFVIHLYSDTTFTVAGTEIAGSGWSRREITGARFITPGTDDPLNLILDLAALKATDTYNKNRGLKAMCAGVETRVDLTQLAMDMGTVTGLVLGNEHVFAFANMVNAGRKRSMGIAQANKEAAKEVANVVERLDVAATSTPKP